MTSSSDRPTGNGARPAIERGLVMTEYGYIHYRASGAGRPLVLVHPQRRSSVNFISTMRDLAGPFRCYAMDLPGHGGDSDFPEKSLTIEDQGAVVHQTMEALGLGKVVLLGHTFGGFVATEVAVAHPESVQGLILQNVPFYPTRENLQQRHALRRSRFELDETGFPRTRSRRDVLEKDMSHLPRVLTQEWLDDDNVELIKCRRHIWDGLDAIAAYDFDSALRHIVCPVLLMWGEGFLYSQHKEEFFRRIKDYRVEWIPNSGIFCQHDNPAAYERAIISFAESL